jgi:tRNA pseudouridine synthase B
MEHPVNETFETAHITSEAIHQALQQFVGEIQQVPPTYSAVKVNGDRAYDLRRKGKDVELAPKTLRIDEIEVQHFDPSQMLLTIRVVCGKGTYIRALARDLGRALNSGAYLTALRRTRVGDVRVENCLQLDSFKEWLDKQEFEEPQTQQQKQQEA